MQLSFRGAVGVPDVGSLPRAAARACDLAWALFFLWCQMVTVMCSDPLILLLALLMVGVLLLRPRAWGRRAGDPGRGRHRLRPRVSARRLAVRDGPLGDGVRAKPGRGRRAAGRSSTYMDAGLENRSTGWRTRAPTRRCSRASAYALVGPPSPWRRGARGRPCRERAYGPGGWSRPALVLTLAVIAVFLATGGGTAHILGVRLRMTELGRGRAPARPRGGVASALEGWAWRRAGDEQALGPREWVPLLGLLAVVFILLSLGPVMHLGGRDVGVGLYAWVYDLYLADPRAARHAPDRLYRHVPARPPRGLRPGRRPGPAVGRPIPPTR